MKLNPNSRNQIRRFTRAFTLVEMLLVLVILGILASIAYPKIANYGVEARIKATRVQIAAFETALDLFEVHNGHYPGTSQGLHALVQAPPDCPDWNGPYVKKVPKDPWGNDYLYERPGTHNPSSFDLMSPGPDGAAETADDITNWEPES